MARVPVVVPILLSIIEDNLEGKNMLKLNLALLMVVLPFAIVRAQSSNPERDWDSLMNASAVREKNAPVLKAIDQLIVNIESFIGLRSVSDDFHSYWENRNDPVLDFYYQTARDVYSVPREYQQRWIEKQIKLKDIYQGRAGTNLERRLIILSATSSGTTYFVNTAAGRTLIDRIYDLRRPIWQGEKHMGLPDEIKDLIAESSSCKSRLTKIRARSK